ncbi:hypothetical protein RJ639_000919 [Escallonia herrerae]|uniref:Succinate-semialdehyde dehydrogenase, mitochondrial n=1 Tax=Escallonia herrerae TaxID=1293975 RepID=A0AA88X9S3_9ASTE|nr:hypothetical protein RJ639_000919 [Escallonia herrerae]
MMLSICFLRFDLIISHKDELAQFMTLEQGKPLKEAIGKVTYGASFIEFFAEEAKRAYGDIIPSPLADRRLFVLKQVDLIPSRANLEGEEGKRGRAWVGWGVGGKEGSGRSGSCGCCWNHYALEFSLGYDYSEGGTVLVGPALACGCTVVIKPSELTPLTALAAAELSLQAGIPAGFVNVVMGNAPDIGDALLESPQVSLELGGNAPCIIFDDADLEAAIKGTLATKFRNSGQTCVCANRIIVQEGIYEKFANAFSKVVQNLKVGDGYGEGVEQVESLIQDAVSKGAKVLLGGKRHSLGMTFYEPTVISDVKNEMRISREEVFGPVAPLLQFKMEEEAIRIANDTNAGLAAYIFTSNISRCWRVSEALEYGIVGVNEGIVSTEVAPFGGVKQSGLGREGSKYGMDEYLEMKYVCLGNMSCS